MKKVNFGVDIKDFKGEAVGKLNEVFANVLQMSTEGNPVKMNSWAVNLYVKGEIEVDDADLQMLIDFITNNKQIPNITKAAALEVMQKAKTEVI